MAAKDITAERLRELFHYNPDTGIFTRRVTRGSGKAGCVVGTFNGHYLQFCVDRNQALAHRLAWLYVHGEWPKRQIDHIDGDKRNNRLSNLRDVTANQNQQNRHGVDPRNRLGVANVCAVRHGRKRFSVTVTANNKTVFNARFLTLEEAQQAAEQARAMYYDRP